MPEILVIEWDTECFRALEVQAQGSQLAIRQVVECPQEQNQEAMLLPQFKALLNERQIRASQVIVTLPRESVVIRRLELPDVADAELPDMVRFQAAAKSSLSLDELALDFLPLPRRAGATGREALLAMVSQTMVSTIREFVSGLGKELTAIMLSPVASTELTARVPELASVDAQSATLLVARHGDRVEISLLHLGQIIFSHGARVNADSQLQANSIILTEISRGLMSFQNLNLGLKVTHAAMLGLPREFMGLPDLLQARYPMTIKVVDPFAITQSTDAVVAQLPGHSPFVGLLGSVLSQVDRKVEAINFLAPRKPPVVVNQFTERKRQIIIGAAGLAVALMIGYGFRLWQLNSEITELQGKIGTLSVSVKKGQPTMTQAQTVQDWLDTSVNWLDAVQKLQSHLPKTDRVYLTRVVGNAPQNKQPARISLEGHAREQQDVRGLREMLMASATGYHLSPKTIEKSDKEYYPWRVSEELLVTKPAATPVKAADSAKPTADTKPTTETKPAESKPAETKDKQSAPEKKS